MSNEPGTSALGKNLHGTNTLADSNCSRLITDYRVTIKKTNPIIKGGWRNPAAIFSHLLFNYPPMALQFHYGQLVSGLCDSLVSITTSLLRAFLFKTSVLLLLLKNNL